MTFDEALGVGRALSLIQRRMLLDLANWPNDEATCFNREELVWKELIYRTSWSPSYRLTERGLAVRTAMEMRALSDGELLKTYYATDGQSLLAVAAVRELEDRWLDL